jgi:uncharacterized damage-inducible protein DinB
MPDLLAPRFRRVFEYERDSHAKILAALEEVPEERRAEESFQKAVDLLAHVVAARMVWLERLGIDKRSAGFFPEHTPLAELPSLLASMHEGWSRYLSGLTDDDVQKHFEYRSSEGERYRNSIEEILTQLYGHSLHHGGQISARIRAMGCVPPETDFIYWARIPLD